MVYKLPLARNEDGVAIRWVHKDIVGNAKVSLVVGDKY
jgi:hypothetical protein